MNHIIFFYPQGHEAHYEHGHPERPERVEAIRRVYQTTGLWDQFEHVEAAELGTPLLEMVHTPDYLRTLQDACEHARHLDMDTYTTAKSWDLALSAAGGAVSVASRVWQIAQNPSSQEQVRGIALTRPPGHHATHNRGMGFCLLNNIAIAATELIQQQSARRVAIIDLDLHHGNGTQDIFWTRNDVFYISTHQSPLYPGTGLVNEIGDGFGKGFNANIPFPPGTGDAGFRSAMDEVILPLLDNFSPEILLVSVGFDPHWLDPLGHLQMSAAGYGELILKLTQWSDAHCAGRIALFLEGGYNLDAAQACMMGCVSALMGIPFKDPLGPSPRPEGKSWQPVIQQVKQVFSL